MQASYLEKCLGLSEIVFWIDMRQYVYSKDQIFGIACCYTLLIIIKTAPRSTTHSQQRFQEPIYNLALLVDYPSFLSFRFSVLHNNIGTFRYTGYSSSSSSSSYRRRKQALRGLCIREINVESQIWYLFRNIIVNYGFRCHGDQQYN